MISRTLFAGVFAVGCFFASPASAQDKLSRTELTAVTTELSLQVEELQARNEQLQVQNADIALQMRELEGQNAQLTGRVETLQFQLGQSRDEAARLQADDKEIGRQLTEFAARISTMETQLARRDEIYALQGDPFNENNPPIQGFASEAPRGGELTGAGEELRLSSVDLPDEAGPLFADAKAKLLRFDYEGAELSFRSFLTRYGETEQAGEAQYWLGEVLFQQKSYADSGAAYADMIQNFPDDVRAPDALVKLGRSLRLIGDAERACAVLGTLPSRYPDASPVTQNLAIVELSRSGCGA